MATAEERLTELGYALPAPLELPPGATLPFPRVRGLAELAFHIPVEIEGEVQRREPERGIT